VETVVIMDKSGRVVLPTHIRKALRIKAPAIFKAEVVGNTIELTVLPSRRGGATIKKRKGLLVLSTSAVKFDAGEAVRSLRDERV
jgi:bifunctional DNA-binding transcriptional regulator/antitoxin component of YhaV-PrlF toxin-antitoxin module